MATNNVSDIVSETIDGEYPVAGVDNDTQGFRDNFSIIKSGLSKAQEEITDLYQRTPKIDEETNFNGSVISQAKFKAITEAVYTIGSITYTQLEIDFSNGHYQSISLGEIIDQSENVINAVNFSLTGWPDGEQYAKMIVQVRSLDPVIKLVNWSTPSGVIKVSENWPGSDFQIDESDTIVEFWSYNGGNTVYGNYIGKFSEL